MKIIILSIVLFFFGVWVFNHFPYPIVGLLIAFGLPLYGETPITIFKQQ